mgnify:FL=1
MKASKKEGFMTENERRIDGVKEFKRMTLGSFRRKSIKTLKEMAQTLYNSRIASSIEEGENITKLLVGKVVNYRSGGDIGFTQMKDREGNIRYAITDYSYDIRF